MNSARKTWKRETLRKIYSSIKDQEGWRIGTNDEVQVMYRKTNIVTIILVIRLERTGHLVRMSVDRTVKKVFLGKPDGRSKAGRPKLRVLDCIENDLKSMGVKEMEEESRRQICMGYHSVGGTG
jgi:hypothetical protein